MNGARLVGRGLHDTFENLISYVMVTMTWWCCIFLVVPGPAATLALFAHADPRHGMLSDRMTWSETLRFIGRNLWRAWGLALLTIPVMALLIYNVIFYSSGDTILGVLTPLWCVLFLFAFATTMTAFSLFALEQLDFKTTIEIAALMVGAHIPRVIVLTLLLWIVLLVGTVLIVPTAMFLPMTVAATFNRFVLSSRKIDIPDPLAPTAERLAEGKTGKRKWWGL